MVRFCCSTARLQMVSIALYFSTVHSDIVKCVSHSALGIMETIGGRRLLDACRICKFFHGNTSVDLILPSVYLYHACVSHEHSGACEYESA